MTKYQLAKLILMAGGLQSRKRVQKTVHLLQAAGCPLHVSFRLHHYGPYSADLAEQLDRMANSGFLQETSVGPQYNYEFNDAMRESLEEFEKTSGGQSARQEMEECAPLLTRLCDTGPRVLELASTVVAFRQADQSWDDAVKETSDFKSEPTDSPTMIRAVDLAKEIVDQDNG